MIIPANADLSSADLDIVSNEKRSYLLHDALRQPAMDAYGFDYILIDCPPALSLLTINALVACDSVLVPLAVRVLRAGGSVAADADDSRRAAVGQSGRCGSKGLC